LERSEVFLQGRLEYSVAEQFLITGKIEFKG